MRHLTVILVCLGLLAACTAYTSDNWPDLGKGFDRRSGMASGTQSESGLDEAPVPAEQPPGAQDLPGLAGDLRGQLEDTQARVRAAMAALQESLQRFEEGASGRERLSAELYLSRLEAALAELRAISAEAGRAGHAGIETAAQNESRTLGEAIQSARRRLSGGD